MLSQVQVQVRRRTLLGLDAKADYNNKSKEYRPTAVAVTVNANGNVLLLQSTKNGKWGFPKGRIEPGEYDRAAYLRASIIAGAKTG